MQYIRLSEGFKNYKLIPITDNPWDHVKTNNRDYYLSLYQYTDDHYKQWKATKSVAGFAGVSTDRILFDFDSKENIAAAQSDALEVITRLAKTGVPQENIQVSFSGSKGFCIEVQAKEHFSPEEFKNITFALADDLKTFDRVVNDDQRLIRLIGTKHQSSGLFKIPLTVAQLSELKVDDIKGLAGSLDNVNQETMDAWLPIELPEAITSKKVTVKPVKKAITTELHDLDMSRKAKWLSEAKYALQEGYFGAGERNMALMILGATYKAQGLPLDIVYRMLKGVAELQAQRNGVERYADEEIYNNVVSVIYKDSWKGGIYAYADTPLLQEVTARLGLNVPSDKGTMDYTPQHISGVHGKFKDYVMNIEKNTIKTGIPLLDKNVFISTGCNLGVLGAPGAGKTAWTLNVLNNTSKAGIKSVFASFDMARTRLYEKILYKLTGLPREVLYNKIKTDPAWEKAIHEQVQAEFGNVFYFDKSAASVEDIAKYIEECNEKVADPNDKIKLVMIDYFERVNSDVGDDTAASKKVAGQLQDIVNRFDVAQIVLLQPNKMSGDMSEPISSYTNIKGSSFLAQSFRIILSMYREGFTPKDSKNDLYLTMNILKNDLGEVGQMDFAWNGKRGEISELDDMGKHELFSLRKRKSQEMEKDLI